MVHIAVPSRASQADAIMPPIPSSRPYAVQLATATQNYMEMLFIKAYYKYLRAEQVRLK